MGGVSLEVDVAEMMQVNEWLSVESIWSDNLCISLCISSTWYQFINQKNIIDLKNYFENFKIANAEVFIQMYCEHQHFVEMMPSFF